MTVDLLALHIVCLYTVKLYTMKHAIYYLYLLTTLYYLSVPIITHGDTPIVPITVNILIIYLIMYPKMREINWTLQFTCCRKTLHSSHIHQLAGWWTLLVRQCSYHGNRWINFVQPLWLCTLCQHDDWLSAADLYKTQNHLNIKAWLKNVSLVQNLASAIS